MTLVRTPRDLPQPPDHDARMAVVRRLSQWELGDESWAPQMIGAYLYPQSAMEYLDNEGADPARTT